MHWFDRIWRLDKTNVGMREGENTVKATIQNLVVQLINTLELETRSI